MKLKTIVVLGMLLWAGLAFGQSQVCTPIAMADFASNTGSGTGPDYNFEINGAWHGTKSGSSVNITVPSTTVTFGDVYIDGYINVYGSFHVGGTCINTPWNAVTSFQGKLFDLTNNNEWVNHCCLQNVMYTNGVQKATTFFFYDYGAASGPGIMTLKAGHVYMWQMNTYTYVYGLGDTPSYNGSVIITVQ